MTFWDSFNVAVHSKPGLPDVDKFNYLKAQVSGEAEQAIGGYLISGDNYVKALATLKERKLPTETKRNLARTQQGGDWTIQGLREALKHELKVLEAGFPLLLESTPTASFFTGVKGPHPQGKGKPKVIQCVYCKGKHSTHNCATVSDPKAGKGIVVKLRLCYNCLSSSHISSKCTSKFRCRQCGGKRHTTICERDKGQGPPPGNKEPPPQADPSQSVHTTLAPAHPYGIPHEYPILLKTAVSHVRVGNTSREVNILLDEGAQRSFITKKLADELGAKPISRENISMSAFGATENSLRKLEVTNVEVISEQGDRIPLRVLVVPHIATPLQCKHHTDVSNIPDLKGFKLAHPVSSGNFEINLLIGADHYWDIVQDKIIRGEEGPTAMQSKLGYLLSGPSQWASPNADPPEKNFLTNYQATSITRDDDGTYIAWFQWKEEHAPLPTNFSICERRTRATARRLHQTPDLMKSYDDIIKEQEARGFIEKLSPGPLDPKSERLPRGRFTLPSRHGLDFSAVSRPRY
ncbi:uncharacterized protein LOC116610191 [Nematostella vectensis]|uniref:uncharacterized protein LOC116610191 n=1 Tax=Nematostella vectensis TaxID=45351 RepID=UPI0020776065|nr:uncharacterized protein LOC116610191 [Nematostella vectensis]